MVFTRATQAQLVPIVDELAATEQVRAEVARAEVAVAVSDAEEAVADVEITELGAGEAFWALLGRAGYSVWWSSADNTR